ncbi:MAG: hypothetical protein MJ113_02685 [Lachnospiraceae bacterium]|nr:hypothetical protein [Lachnospiraceae bacterium]
MKIKVKKTDYEKFLQIEPYPKKNPCKQSYLLKKLVEFIARKDLKMCKFHADFHDMDKLGDEPALILMNHSSFIDLEIAFKLFKDRRFNIVATDDGFVGKEVLLRKLGCIPTLKFISDPVLVKHMIYAVKTLRQSILMYPEASYSFDGTATALPKSIGKCIKLLNIPVVIVNTHGAFLRDPLYNNLQIRNVEVSADVTYVLSKEDIKSMRPDEILSKVDKYFDFDNFKEQYEKKIYVKEAFRADFLNRILYKCTECGSEGNTLGKGTSFTCKSCGMTAELSELGRLRGSKLKFSHIPDWYKWQRECVREEIKNGTYEIKEEVKIYGLRDLKALYELGDGVLTHNCNGFELKMNNETIFSLSPKMQYSLYSDYYWYELGDSICIGDDKSRFYCIIKSERDVVAKARIAQEEMFTIL